MAEFWPQLRDKEIDRDMEEVTVNGSDPVFINKGEGEYPNWLGYSLAYQIGKKLLEKHDLKQFPEIDREDFVKAGNEIYLGN